MCSDEPRRSARMESCRRRRRTGVAIGAAWETVVRMDDARGWGVGVMAVGIGWPKVSAHSRQEGLGWPSIAPHGQPCENSGLDEVPAVAVLESGEAVPAEAPEPHGSGFFAIAYARP